MRKIKRIIVAASLATISLSPVVAPMAIQTECVLAATTTTGISKQNGVNYYQENGKNVKKTGNITINGKKYYVRNGIVYGEVVKVETGWYEIHSAVAGKTDYNVDVSGCGFKEGSNVQIHRDNNTIAQRFHFRSVGDGIYHIACGTGNHTKFLDVAGGKKGENIRQWTDNESNAEKFRVVKNANGTISLINEATGQALDISGDDNFGNGRNVWDFPFMYGNDKGQMFNLEKICNTGELPWNTSGIASGWYNIHPSKNIKEFLDVTSNKSTTDTNIQLWSSTGSNAQKFYVKNLGNGDYAFLTGSSNAKMAVDGGRGQTKDGFYNVKQYPYTTGNNWQIWRAFKFADGSFKFVNKATGQALDVPGINTYTNGTNIWTYKDSIASNGLKAAEGQAWTLSPVGAPSYKGATVTAEMFGAKGDGKTNDTAAIQKAVDSGASTVVLSKTYYIKGGVGISKGNVTFTGNGTIILPNDGNTSDDPSAFSVHAKNTNFKNLNFKSTYQYVQGNETKYHGRCIHYYTKNTDPKGTFNFNSEVSNCTFKNTGRRAVGVAAAGHNADPEKKRSKWGITNTGNIPRPGHITIKNNDFTDNNGITVCTAGATNLTISGNTFKNSGLEHITLDWGTKNSTVSNNKFYGKVGGCGVIGSDTASNNIIKGNTFAVTRDNGQKGWFGDVTLNDLTGKSSNMKVQKGAWVRSDGKNYYGTTTGPKFSRI